MNNAFKNDGSFLEQFLKGKQQKDEPSSYAQDPSYQDPQYQQMNYGYATQAMYANAYPYANYGYNPMANTAYVSTGGPPPNARNETPSRSLWVGSLHPDTTETDLRREFSMFGMIESIKMLLHKNCCFINFADLDSAMAAHANSYGKIINGQSIRVGYGKPDTTQDERFKTERYTPCKNLWVGNLSEQVSEEDIRREFDPYGRIERIRLLSHKNCAFVNFSTVNEAMMARNNIQGKLLYDRPIRINFGRDDDRDRDQDRDRDRGGDRGDRDRDRGGYNRGGPRNKEFSNVPPPFSYPPQDLALKETISQVCAMIVRRGLSSEMFEAFLKLKGEERNEKMEFFFGGEGNAYYKWKLYCLRFNHPEDQPPPQSAQAPPPTGPALDPAEKQEFESILQQLQGTKDAIHYASSWIAQRPQNSTSIVSVVDDQIKAQPAGEQRLFIFYVVNDLLSMLSKTRQNIRALDPISAALLEKLPGILRAVYASPEHQEKVVQVLDYWKSKEYYEEEIIHRLLGQLQSEAPPPPPEDDDDVPPWLRNDNPGGSGGPGAYGGPPAYPPSSYPPWGMPNNPPPPPPSDPSLMDSVSEYYSDVKGNRR